MNRGRGRSRNTIATLAKRSGHNIDAAMVGAGDVSARVGLDFDLSVQMLGTSDGHADLSSPWAIPLDDLTGAAVMSARLSQVFDLVAAMTGAGDVTVDVEVTEPPGENIDLQSSMVGAGNVSADVTVIEPIRLVANMVGVGDMVARVTTAHDLVAAMEGAGDATVDLDVTTPAAITKAFQYSSTQTTDANTYNFTSVPFGAADASRKIVVAVHGEDTTNHSITSVTVGGVAAYPLLGIVSLSSLRHESVWMADVPSGTSGTVTVVFSATTNDCTIGVWSLHASGGSAIEPYAMADSKHSVSGTNVMSSVVPTLDLGCILAAATNTGSFAASWTGTGMTERYDDATSTHGASGADAVTTGANVTVGYTHAGGASGSSSIAAMSFGHGGNLWMKQVAALGLAPSSATHTYSSVRFGGGRADRHIVVAVECTSGNGTISSVTIAGVTATPIVTHGSGSLLPGGIFYAKVPTGTTGDVVVTFNSSKASSVCSVWVVFGSDDIEVVDSGAVNNASPLTDTLAADEDGIVLAFSCTGFVEFTSPTTPYFQDFFFNTTPNVARGSGSQRTFGSSVTVTSDNGAAGSTDWMTCCTLRPAA